MKPLKAKYLQVWVEGDQHRLGLAVSHGHDGFNLFFQARVRRARAVASRGDANGEVKFRSESHSPRTPIFAGSGRIAPQWETIHGDNR